MKQPIRLLAVLVLALVLSPALALAQETCSAGVTGEPVALFPRALGNDLYFNLLDPSTCGCAGSTWVTSLHAVLDIADPGCNGCAFDISCAVGLDPADLSVPGCPRPGSGDLYAMALMKNVAPGTVELEFPLPTPQPIDGPVFIHFYANWGTLRMPAGCRPCVSWVKYAEGNPMDTCVELPYGNPLIWATVTCEQPVGTHRATWGSLKSLYR